MINSDSPWHFSQYGWRVYHDFMISLSELDGDIGQTASNEHHGHFNPFERLKQTEPA